MNVRAHGHAGVIPGEEAVSLREEILQGPAANLSQPPRRSKPPVPRVEDYRITDKHPAAVERKLAFGALVQPHLRPVTRQAEYQSYRGGCQQAADIH